MTFATELRDAMTLAASIVSGDTRMGRAARDAAADVMLEDDLILTATAMVPLILALEEIEAVAKDNAGRARAALCAALEATTGQVRAGIHTATTTKGRASVTVTDDNAIPQSFMRQPPPQPDKAAILAAIKAGAEVPGVVLRNGAPTLTIRTNARETAA